MIDKHFANYYSGIDQPSKEIENSFNALLAYEKNCILKYDRPNKPSICPKRGERMQDFALKFNTSIELMKKQRNMVELYLEIQ